MRVRTRVGTTIADQAVSSVGNLALAVIIARRSSPDAYGAFALAFGAYAVLLGFHRAAITDPLVYRYSGVDARRRSGTVLAASALISAPLMLVLATIGAVVGGGAGRSFVALGTGGLGLLTVDALRYVFLAEGRPQRALVIDLVWTVGTIGIILSPLVQGRSGAELLFIWAAMATATVVVTTMVLALSRQLLGGVAVVEWLSEARGLVTVGVVEFAVVGAGSQVLLFLVAALDDLSAAGAFRGALVILGAATVVNAGLVSAGAVEIRRLGPRSLRAALVPGVLLAASMAVTVIAAGVFASLLPHETGEILLGATWPAARELVLPLSLAVAGTSAMLGWTTTLKVAGHPREALMISVPTVLTYLAAAVVGTVAHGARGTAWAMAVTCWTGVGIAIWRFKRTSLTSSDLCQEGMPVAQSP